MVTGTYGMRGKKVNLTSNIGMGRTTPTLHPAPQPQAVRDAYGKDKGLAYALAEAKRKHKKHLNVRLKRQPSLMGREPSDEEVCCLFQIQIFGGKKCSFHLNQFGFLKEM